MTDTVNIIVRRKMPEAFASGISYLTIGYAWTTDRRQAWQMDGNTAQAQERRVNAGMRATDWTYAVIRSVPRYVHVS